MVEGKPSIALFKEYERKKKKHRSEKRDFEKKRKKRKVEIARLPGKEQLAKIPFADVEKIQFRTVTSYNRSHNPHNLFDFSQVRFPLQISDVRSKFVTILIHIDVSHLSHNQKSYLPLLLTMWKHSSIKKNGTIMSQEEVQNKYDKSELYMMVYSSIKITTVSLLENLKEGISFLGDIINYPYFTPNKLKETIVKRIEEEKEQIIGSSFKRSFFKASLLLVTLTIWQIFSLSH